MKYKIYQNSRKCLEILRSRRMILSLMLSMVLLVFFQMIAGLNMYIIFDGDDFTVHKSYVSNAEAALAEAGIQISRDDVVFLPEATRGGVVEIHIERSHTVFIDAYGEKIRLSTLGDTVGDALHRAGIELDGQDIVNPDPLTPVWNGMNITVWRKEVRLETITDTVPFTIERVADDNMLKDKEETVQEGSVGEKTFIYEVYLRNGEETERRLLSNEITTPAKNTIIHYGTKKPEPPKPSISIRSNPSVKPDDEGGGTLTIPSGEEIRYKKMYKMTATAYTTERQKNKRTASGTTARVGAIAVDPKVIPLGTRVYIEIPGGQWFYGFAVCEDTGGAIKGNIIDLFFNTYDECVRFGRRGAILYVLE